MYSDARYIFAYNNMLICCFEEIKTKTVDNCLHISKYNCCPRPLWHFRPPGSSGHSMPLEFLELLDLKTSWASWTTLTSWASQTSNTSWTYQFFLAPQDLWYLLDFLILRDLLDLIIKQGLFLLGDMAILNINITIFTNISFRWIISGLSCYRLFHRIYVRFRWAILMLKLLTCNVQSTI